MKKFILVLNIFSFFYIFLIISGLIINESVCDTEPDDEYDYDVDADGEFIHRGNDIFREYKIKVKRSGYFPAKLGRFPFVVAVFNGKNKEKTCGGIILNDLVILTAGYCIIECKDQPEMISVLGGVVDMKDHVRDQWRYGNEIIFYNKSYEKIPYLAGIKVNAPFYLHYILQAKPTPSTPFTSNNLCFLSSWHLKDKIKTILENESTIKSSILKYIPAHPIDRNLCYRMLKEKDKNKTLGLEEILCLPDTNQPKTFDDDKEGLRSNRKFLDCVGSAGTILSCSNPDGVLIPIGIATSEPGGFFCFDHQDAPTGFFDLGNFASWIKEKLFETPEDFDKMSYSASLSRKETNMKNG